MSNDRGILTPQATIPPGLGNRYRLITVVHYAKTTGERQTEGHVYIRSFLTHAEYNNRSKLG